MTDGRGQPDGGDGARLRRPSHRRTLALGLIAAVATAADAADGPSIKPPDLIAGSAVQQQADAAVLAAACDDAAFLIAAGRAREAVGRLEPVLRSAGTDHPQHARGKALLAAARAAEVRGDIQSAEEARLASATAARDHAADGARISASLRAERLARVRDLHARGHLELALAHLRALLHDLPGDDEVDGIFRVLLDEAHTVRTAAIADRERELRAEVSVQVERSLIPEGFDGRPMFPSDWTLRRAGRHSLFDTPEEVPAWQQAIADRLSARITVGFDGTPVAEVIDVVARLGGVNIITAPEILAAADRIITLRATGMRLEDVLTWVAEQAGTRWSLANGAVFIGEAAEGARTTVIHDIAELLLGTDDFPGLNLDLSTIDGSGGGGAGFLAPAAADQPQKTVDDVADLVKRSVSPRTWATDGNAIAVRGDALLVTAPADVQRLIREFLRAQSAQHSLSVRVDARWLELYDRYVEEIGVTWNSGPGQMIDPGPGRRGGYVRNLDGWAFNGMATSPLPGSAMSVQPATAGSGLTLQSAFLGSSQISAVLSAVERNSQGRVLQAPELTCLNGQQANVFFGSQFAYISDYTLVSSTFDPVISTINLGMMLEVRPLVSADRKFVTLELRTASVSATLFTENIVGIDVINLIPANFPIQMPNVAIRTAGTTVMLPDRGSVLVGGFNASLDQFANTRVPLLGSVPFLGRLFGTRGRYSDKSKLYLLTTATIINYPELEARL